MSHQAPMSSLMIQYWLNKCEFVSVCKHLETLSWAHSMGYAAYMDCVVVQSGKGMTKIYKIIKGRKLTKYYF